MRSLYIHIGAHKTGTTSLQYVLSQNRQKLRQDAGVLYPEACGFQYAQHRLAFAAKSLRDPRRRDVPDFDSEMSALRRETSESPCDRVVVSSEEFFSLDRREINRVVQGLRETFDRIKVLACVRRQDSQFLSIYNQKVKTPDNGFFAHVSKFMEKPESLDPELDYYRFLTDWKAALGDLGQVQVYIYEQENDIVGRMYEELTGVVCDSDVSRLNPSMPVLALEFIRHVKAKTKDVEVIRQFSKQALRVFGQDVGGSLLSLEERQAIVDYFEERNKRMDEEFGVRSGYVGQLDGAGVSEKRMLTVNDVIRFVVSQCG